MEGTLENLGIEAQEKAIKLKVEGLSNLAIADKLNENYNSDLNSEEVRHFFRRKEDKFFKIAKDDKKLQTKLSNEYFNTIQQLKDLNGEMWKLFYEIRKNPEEIYKEIHCPECNHKFRIKLKSYMALLKTADHLLKQIQHTDAILGKIQNKNINISYNVVDLSKKLTLAMPQMLERCEKSGIIKGYNKKRLRKIMII